MDDDQQFCLRWNNHQTTLISVFDTLLEKGMHVDCSLAAEGKTLKAHKVVLSACSPYFENVLSQQYDKHPIIILKDVKYAELRAMMDYMYRGEVNISQDQLAALLKAAESLQIKGLSDNKPPRPSSPSVKSKLTESVSTLQSRESSSSPVPRKRKKPRRTSTDILNQNHNEPLPTTAAPATQTHTPLALPLPHPVPLAIPIAIPPSAPTPIIKPIIEPINLNLENNIVPATPKLKMGDIMNNIPKNNKVDNNNMELGVAKLEFGSEGPEESVEDLTLDEEGEAEGDGGEEEEAGSSKYGDIVQNFQCYMERSQDEAALSGQDGPRDSQGKPYV